MYFTINNLRLLNHRLVSLCFTWAFNISHSMVHPIDQHITYLVIGHCLLNIFFVLSTKAARFLDHCLFSRLLLFCQFLFLLHTFLLYGFFVLWVSCNNLYFYASHWLHCKIKELAFEIFVCRRFLNYDLLWIVFLFDLGFLFVWFFVGKRSIETQIT